MLFFENGLEMEFKTYLATINPFQHYNGGITMKTFKNNFVARRLWAFALVFAFAIGMFGNTTAFAAEASTNAVISHVVCHGSSQGYTNNSCPEYTLKVEKPGAYYISYLYENESGNLLNHGKLQIVKSSGGSPVAGCTLIASNTGGTEPITLETGNYKVRILPGEKTYMYSFNIYWKEYK